MGGRFQNWVGISYLTEIDARQKDLQLSNFMKVGKVGLTFWVPGKSVIFFWSKLKMRKSHKITRVYAYITHMHIRKYELNRVNLLHKRQKTSKSTWGLKHCVTGAVSTHDVMYTRFYFWKPLKSALCTKVAWSSKYSFPPFWVIHYPRGGKYLISDKSKPNLIRNF